MNTFTKPQAPPYLLSLLFLIGTVTALRIYLLHLQIWPINGDESQYWGWAQHLTLGYYSKPPLLAWLIALTTYFMGDGALGLRLASPLCYAGSTLMVYAIGRGLYNPQIGFWAGLLFLTAPGVSFSATLISTDPPLLLCWSIAFYALFCAVNTQSLSAWFITGLALGLAFLSKYAAIFFMLSMTIYLLVTPNGRLCLRHRGVYLCLGTTLLLLLPNLYWNFHHGFVSFLAVKDNADLHGLHWHIGNWLNFTLTQLVILGPLLFSILLYLIVSKRARATLAVTAARPSHREGLLLSFVWPLLLVMSIEGLVANAHGNWAAPIYITGVVAATAFLVKTQRVHWLIYSLILNLLIIAGLFSVETWVTRLPIHLPLTMTQTHWPATAKAIQRSMQEQGYHDLIVDDRMLLAQTLYFTKLPHQHIFKWNPSQRVKDQYDMVTDLTTATGRDFLLLSYRTKPQDILQHFHNYRYLTTLKVSTLDGRGIHLYLYGLKGFLGYQKSE